MTCLSLHLFTYPEIDAIVAASRLTKPQLVSAPGAGPSNRRLRRSQARWVLDLSQLTALFSIFKGE